MSPPVKGDGCRGKPLYARQDKSSGTVNGKSSIDRINGKDQFFRVRGCSKPKSHECQFRFPAFTPAARRVRDAIRVYYRPGIVPLRGPTTAEGFSLPPVEPRSA